MDRIDEKIALILAETRRFAHVLGAKVMPKPKVSMWMILLPILFVFYMNDVKKYRNGRREFAEHYARTGERALSEAAEVLRQPREPAIPALVQQSGLSPEGQSCLSEVYTVLVEHYQMLLRAEGEDWGALVREAYGDKTHYLLFLNNLNRLERNLNAAVLDRLGNNTEGAGDIIQAIEIHAEAIRRAEADAVFA